MKILTAKTDGTICYSRYFATISIKHELCVGYTIVYTYLHIKVHIHVSI